MAEAALQVARERVALVVLNRPQVLNAFDWSLRDALTEALRALDDDDLVRAIVLTGAGDRAFSAGQDLGEAEAYGVGDIGRWMSHQRRMYQALRACRKPVVVAFNGLAAGSGFHLGLLADLRVGSAAISLGQPEIRMGLASIVGPYLMSHYMGHAQVAEFAIAGRMVSGQRAHELGLLTELVPAGDVRPRACALAAELAEHPADAMRLTKAYFVARTQAGFDQAFDEVVRCHRIEYESGLPQQRMRQFAQRQRDRRAKP